MKKQKSQNINILIAEDDAEDRLFIRDAFEEARVANKLYFVNDGEELIDFLKQGGKYADPDTSPRPGLILIDLNMPRKNGYEALKEIKSDDRLKDIPVVILTTSQDEQEILRTYELGCSSFITKPVTFDALVDVIQAIGKYWLSIVSLPK